MRSSESIAEALLYKLLTPYKIGHDLLDELEIVDCDMLKYGQWRTVFWVRPRPSTPLYKRYGSSIRCLVLHESSVVEVVADAPPPKPLGDAT